MHSILNKAVTFAILVLFLLQVSATAVSSCSQIMMANGSFTHLNTAPVTNQFKDNQSRTSNNTYPMMDHSQHMMMASVDDKKSDNSKENCCDDSCNCEMASCSYSNLMNHSTGFIFANQVIQSKILFIVSSLQSQHLNYLFKPPIRRLA